MTHPPHVLIIDDRAGDVIWLLDLIRGRGYEIVLASNEKTARQRLEAVHNGSESYSLAIVDVMVALDELTELIALDDRFFEESEDTGLRLCRFARRELGLSPDVLPIVCLTAREDEKVKEAMRELDIPLFHRTPAADSDSIRGYIEDHLPVVKV